MKESEFQREYGKWIDFDPENPRASGVIDGETVAVHEIGRGVNFLTYNEYHECWDDIEGDDFYCHLDQVDKICIIPPFI